MNNLEEELTQQSDSTREITLGGEWVIPAQDGFARRTLVKGAAWTIPVVSLAIATPAAAASNSFVCPTVPASSGWTGPSGLEGNSGGTGSYGWSGDQWNNSKDATQSNSFSYYIEFSFKGVAGHSYNFNWSAYSNGVGGGASYVAYDVLIGGNAVYSASTDPRSDARAGAAYLDPNTSTPVAASSTFTPTTDGTYTFRYRIRLSQLGGTQTENNNVVIKMPTLTCS